MPNRIIREGILTSPRMAKLTWPEEVFYRRLLSVVDDFGRYYADPGLLHAACYPRQLSKVSDSDIGKWLRVCADAALVRVYPAQDGESYLEVIDFGQQVRAKKSKFPDPIITCAAVASQKLANDHLGVSVSVSVSESVLSSPAGSAPAPASDLFDEFWKAYPNKVGKDAARKAFDKRKPARALLDAMLAAIGVQRTSKQWTDDGGRYIPHPSTWLNEGRWQDEGIQAQGNPGAPVDPDSQPAIEAEGVRLGLGKWSGLEQFPIYRNRVRDAQAVERGASGGLH